MWNRRSFERQRNVENSSSIRVLVVLYFVIPRGSKIFKNDNCTHSAVFIIRHTMPGIVTKSILIWSHSKSFQPKTAILRRRRQVRFNVCQMKTIFLPIYSSDTFTKMPYFCWSTLSDDCTRGFVFVIHVYWAYNYMRLSRVILFDRDRVRVDSSTCSYRRIFIILPSCIFLTVIGQMGRLSPTMGKERRQKIFVPSENRQSTRCTCKFNTNFKKHSICKVKKCFCYLRQ